MRVLCLFVQTQKKVSVDGGESRWANSPINGPSHLQLSTAGDAERGHMTAADRGLKSVWTPGRGCWSVCPSCWFKPDQILKVTKLKQTPFYLAERTETHGWLLSHRRSCIKLPCSSPSWPDVFCRVSLSCTGWPLSVCTCTLYLLIYYKQIHSHTKTPTLPLPPYCHAGTLVCYQTLCVSYKHKHVCHIILKKSNRSGSGPLL